MNLHCYSPYFLKVKTKPNWGSETRPYLQVQVATGQQQEEKIATKAVCELYQDTAGE